MINNMLEQYRHLIDFDDNMQKNNFKFVEKYIHWQKRKNKNWKKDCVEFLKDAIDLQKKLLNYIRQSLLIK